MVVVVIVECLFVGVCLLFWTKQVREVSEVTAVTTVCVCVCVL